MALKFKEIPETSTRPDDRGRITLGSSLTSGVSRYDVFVNETTGELLLRPFKEIPANETWLYENKKALDLVHKGLKAVQKGKITKVNLKEGRWIEDIDGDE